MYSKALLLSSLVAITSARAQFEWDCTNSLGPCNNACYASNHGLASGLLTYDANNANRRPRRTASGCNRTPCSDANLPYLQFGDSCDEYPFASTQEGGNGAILRCVDSTENSSEGGQLGNFYKTINDGDQFDVFVRNYGGATFCSNVNAANDGGEFRLVNGAFQNAKMRRDVSAFTDAPAGTPMKLREFLNENGETLMLLNPYNNDTLVDTQVFDGTKYTRIVREI